ncbi:MAG: malate dehydrogenase, partial [Deltaproteobacteria bacterium]|nr:malate dehydrogenase [Deltaproteobacteria bacterium]
MAEAILKDKKKILPCSAYLQGEYGVENLFLGVPVKLGRNGIEKIIQINLTEDEQVALQSSANAVKELVESLKKIQAPS